MFHKIILILTIICLCVPLIAQDSNDDDIFDVKFEQKSAKKAMLLSTLFPGAGQFYANPKSITTYLFPILEIGLWTGYFYYQNEGKKIEDDYEEYANKEIIGTYAEDVNFIYTDHNGNQIQIDIEAGDPIYRYDRRRQFFVQEDLIENSANSFYDNHFRLDETNTQHFYEDIGKYNKYIFGWADWFDVYATNNDGEWSAPSDDSGPEGTYWIWDSNKWVGNVQQNDNSEYYNSTYDTYGGVYSDMRDIYIGMRQDAEDNYEKADLMTFGIVINHIGSAFDALRVVRKKNMDYLSQHNIDVNVTPMFVENHLVPGLFIQKRF